MCTLNQNYPMIIYSICVVLNNILDKSYTFIFIEEGCYIFIIEYIVYDDS